MQDRNIKGDHFHLERIGAPQLLREFINLYRWYFFNFRGFKFKMSSPSQSSPSRNYTSPFSGVVLLSLFVAGLQNSLINRVECMFSTIPTCVHLPGGVGFLSVYLRIYRCTVRLILTLTILFYSILLIFYSILFYIFYSVFYSILLYNSLLCSIL